MQRGMAAVLVAVAVAPGLAQAQAAGGALGSALARVHRLEEQRDYEGAYLLADSLLRVYPRSLELRSAWLSGLRSLGFSARPIRLAESLAKEYPDSVWAQRSLELVPGKGKQVLAAMQGVRARMPWDPDVLTATASAMQTAGPLGPVQAVALLDSALARGVRTYDVLCAKAAALLERGYPKDSAGRTVDQAAEIARDAIRLDSTRVPGYLALASALDQKHDSVGASLAYGRAARLAQVSSSVHEEYWASLRRAGGDSVQIRDEIVADVHAMVAARRSPFALRTLANALDRAGIGALADSLRHQLFALDPDGVVAEAAYVDRIYDLTEASARSTNADSLRRVRARWIRAYLARPALADPEDLGETDAFWQLVGDSTFPTAALERIGRLVQRAHYPFFWQPYQAAMTLVDRGSAPGLARALVGIIPEWAAVSDSVYGSVIQPDQVEEFRQYRRGWPHEVLGWLAFKQGRAAAGAAELRRALEVAPDVASIYYHAGRIAEARGRSSQAERLYARGYAVERSTPTRDNERALRRLYVLRRGSDAGFDRFVSGLQEKERAARKLAVLSARRKAPPPMPRFHLRGLDGDTLSSAALAGKVVVMNFWYTSCGPCIQEMPYLQKAYDRYRSDPGVVFLSIDHGDEAAGIRSFLARHPFTLPVLLDDGYADRSDIRSYPTTWFVGRDGRIAFEVVGNSHAAAIEEEFGWRIEALKAGK